jgi:hypothetical protein
MRTTILENQEGIDLELNQEIDGMLLDVYQAIPSSGTYPFTIIRIVRTELNGLNITPDLLSGSQILVLKRTDFDLSDLMDYVIHTTEYSTIRSDRQEDFLDGYKLKYLNTAALTGWSEQIISLGIGMAKQLARQKRINLIPVEADLSQLDSRFGFQSRNLQAYQLFDLNPIQ